jgi:hypothetical protein
MHQNIAADDCIEWRTVRQCIVRGHDEFDLRQASLVRSLARDVDRALLAIESHHMARAADGFREKHRHIADTTTNIQYAHPWPDSAFPDQPATYPFNEFRLKLQTLHSRIAMAENVARLVAHVQPLPKMGIPSFHALTDFAQQRHNVANSECHGFVLCEARPMGQFIVRGNKERERVMRLQPIILAASLLLASAGFDASFAQSSAVSEKTFDWIFFVIIGIPFILALVGLLAPGVLDRFVRDWPWETRRAGLDARHNERSGPSAPTP